MVNHPSRACPHFLERFTEFVDDVLPLEHRARFEAHLDCCEGCLHHLAAYRKGVDALRSVPEAEIEPGEFWERLQSRLWIDRLEAPPAPVARRVFVYGAMATAVVALAFVWLGGQLDLGLQRVSENARPPIVVMAAGTASGSPAVNASRAGGASVTESATDAPARRSPQTRASTPPVQLASAMPIRHAIETPEFDNAAEAIFEREVRVLRERLEVEAGLGESILTAGTVEVLPSEPIPVSRFLTASYERP